jgi:hypothetical protein
LWEALLVVVFLESSNALLEERWFLCLFLH